MRGVSGLTPAGPAVDRGGARTSPPPVASSRVARALRPADAALPVNALELLLFGALCYVCGFASGAVPIPWLVDRGLFPVHRRER
jgi:hypothetical protein